MLIKLKSSLKIRPFWSFAANMAVVVVILFAGINLTADFTLEKILELDYFAAHDQWQKVYDLSEKHRLRNNLATYYTNMALGKLGILPEKLLEFYQPAATGLFIPVNANENYVTITFSNEVYWQLGAVNSSQHSALLGMIFSPQTYNIRLLKRLAEINIINGEYAVAEKYLKIISGTLYHRKWAIARMKLLNSEAECSRTGWVISKRELIPVNDHLELPGEYQKTLRMLIVDHPGNRMAVDYLLCYDLLGKDLRSFMEDFWKYFPRESLKVLPRVYQEAILMQVASGKYSRDDFPGAGFTPEYVRKIADYTRKYSEANGNGAALQKDFGSTYWFYYHFAAMKKN
jgi:hypothetical protein